MWSDTLCRMMLLSMKLKQEQQPLILWDYHFCLKVKRKCSDQIMRLQSDLTNEPALWMYDLNQRFAN